jgi:D-glycero-D-manno-heptose 1,7-bisphosphate phosphatase
MMQKAVFLDRDGTLNVERGYLRELSQLELLPGAAQAVRALNDAGILAILTTNQTGAARGFYPESHIHALNARLQQLLLEQAGAKLDAVFACPHLEKGVVAEFAVACHCRKPETGMIAQALEQFPGIDLATSYVVGDKATDVDFAYAAGCQSILVKTGYGERVLAGKYQSLPRTPHFVCADVLEAVQSVVLAGEPLTQAGVF